MTERDAGGPILFFDGDCALCHRAVRFVWRRDRAGVFRFAPLHGTTARRLGVEPPPGTPAARESLVLYENGVARERSDAVLRIVAILGGVLGWLRVFAILPRPLRDALYAFVARVRFRIFGRSGECLIPEGDRAGRLLD